MASRPSGPLAPAGAALLALVALIAIAPARAQDAPPPGPPPAAAPAVPEQEQAPTAPPGPLETTIVRPRGPQYGYPDPADPERFLWVFLGGVEIEQPGRRLVGETLVIVMRAAGEPTSSLLEPAAGPMQFGGDRLLELYLDGNVRVEEGDEQISGASAFHLDATTGVATVVQGELRSDMRDGLPLVGRFALLKRLQDGTTYLNDLTYTNCEYERPHWHIHTPYARLAHTPRGRVLSTGPNVAKVGGLPVLWLPGVDLSVDGGGLLLSGLHVGTSSRFGTMIETEWKADASPLASAVTGLFGDEVPVEADFDLGVSWLSKRGVLLEPEIEYRTAKSRGRLFGSYINDSEDTDHLGQPIDDHTRGWAKIEHRTRIDEHQTLDVEVSKVSDANFLNEYYESEAKEEKPQETYVSYRNVIDNHALTALAGTRLNDFQEQTVYQPEIAARQAGAPLPGGFFVTAKEFVSNAALAHPDGSGEPTVGDLRAGVDVLVTRPWDFEGGDRVQFITELGATGFEETVDGESAVRYALGAGLEFSRTWSGTGPAASETWNLDGLRRIVEARAGVFDRFEVSKLPDELLQIDQVEQREEIQVIELGLRDRIQTHQAGQVATLLDTDLALPIYPDQDRDNDGDHYGPLRVDSVWRPAADVFGLRRAKVHWRAKLDVNDWHYTESLASYSTALGESRKFGISQNSLFHGFTYRTVGLAWKLSPKWDTAVYYQQDVENNQTARSGFLLRQLAHCWYIDYELGTRQAVDVDGSDDDEIEVAIRLTPAVLQRDRDLVDEIGGRIP